MNCSPTSETTERLVISAASSGFGPALLAMLGSMNLNWPGHPAVRIYDLGMKTETLEILETNQISVIKVPPFCPHWRKYYTWKLWCLNEAPAQQILWIDAGIAVMQPLDEVFKSIDALGYFVLPNYQLLDWEASEVTCKGCGLDPAFRLGKPTLPSGLIGFDKRGKALQVLQEALSVALVEENIKQTNPRNRFEQSIISLLMYKYFNNIVLADGLIYLGDKSPEQVPGQKIWVHRRGMLAQDLEFYRNYIAQSGHPRPPLNPSKNRPKNPIVLGLRFIRSRYWRIRHRLEPPKIYDGVRDD
jgi:hypothetical protein